MKTISARDGHLLAHIAGIADAARVRELRAQIHDPFVREIVDAYQGKFASIDAMRAADALREWNKRQR